MEEPETAGLASLPIELFINIVHRLGPDHQQCLKQTSKYFHAILEKWKLPVIHSFNTIDVWFDSKSTQGLVIKGTGDPNEDFVRTFTINATTGAINHLPLLRAAISVMKVEKTLRIQTATISAVFLDTFKRISFQSRMEKTQIVIRKCRFLVDEQQIIQFLSDICCHSLDLRYNNFPSTDDDEQDTPFPINDRFFQQLPGLKCLKMDDVCCLPELTDATVDLWAKSPPENISICNAITGFTLDGLMRLSKILSFRPFLRKDCFAIQATVNHLGVYTLPNLVESIVARGFTPLSTSEDTVYSCETTSPGGYRFMGIPLLCPYIAHAIGEERHVYDQVFLIEHYNRLLPSSTFVLIDDRYSTSLEQLRGIVQSLAIHKILANNFSMRRPRNMLDDEDSDGFQPPNFDDLDLY